MRLSKQAAVKGRDSLARGIYLYVLQHIIDIFNGNVKYSSSYIGILDIAGFGKKIRKQKLKMKINESSVCCRYISERLEDGRNCFEQFCINYENERFQQLFVQKMLKIEEDWYRSDGLDVPNIPFFDNIGIISN